MIRSRLYKHLLGALGAALMALALMAPVATAQSPNPGYEQFSDCPTPAELPGEAVCFRSDITGGHFKMGKQTVQIKNPISLTGAYNENLEYVPGSKGGLSESPQEVPGGLVGLTGLDWLVNYLGAEALKVYAVTELAGQPGYILEEPFRLPIKVRLVNPALGKNCYVGSNANPIMLNLGVGPTNPPPPNQPLTGVPPKLSFGADEVLRAEDGVLVDNEFAAPGADGCGLNVLGLLPIDADPLVNLQAGLPSPAGNNETVQHVDAEVVERWLVYP